MLIADYSKPNNASTGNNYLEQLSYDKNGNILTLIRNGDLDSDGMIPSVQIDNLVYTYDNTQSPNRLMKVMDFSASPQGFKDDGDGVTDPNGDDYDYDLNGNMTVDQNKGITAITYNHLNLPVSISFGTNGTITYLYDASGRKVKKDVQDNTTSINTVVDYLSGGFQYENAQLQFFPHAEGYVNATKTRGGYLYNYVFNYTDHLGNIRLSYTYDEYIGQLKTLEENHYYPFGLKHTNYNSDYRRIVKTLDESGTRTKIPSGSFPTTEYTDYKYKYNGKELQDELGLNMYDYGARNYDPALGRWMNIDPLAEEGRRWSPYNYAMDNPVYFVDPDGMLSQSFIDELWNKSGDGETKWTNNDNGSFSNSNGESISSGEHDSGGENGGDGDPKKLKSVNKNGEKVLEAKKTLLGKLWGSIVQREWTDPETGLVYTVNADGTISGLRPLGGLGPLGFVSGGGGFKIQNIAGFYVRAKTFLSGGTYTKTIQSLASLEEGTSLVKLVKIFEAEAKGAGATKIVIKGTDIVEKRLISNIKYMEKLGYKVEKTTGNTIQISKGL